jgi:hypothetical protein
VERGQNSRNRTSRRLRYVFVVGISLLLAWRLDLCRRPLIMLSALSECSGCSFTKRVRQTASALTIDPALAERYEQLPSMTGARVTFLYEFPTVGVLLLDGRLLCTGTLIRHPTIDASVIGSDVVLTAAHCVVGLDRSRLRFGFGRDIAAAKRRLFQIRDVQYPSGYPDSRFNYDPKTYADDVALIYLRRKALTRTSTIASSPPRLPALLEFVGYGFNLQGLSGIRGTASSSQRHREPGASNMVIRCDPS